MKEKIQKIIQDILKVLSEEEKTELLKWAEGARKTIFDTYS